MAQEKLFENKVKKFLKDENCWFLKTWSNGVQRSGVPDILINCNGFFIGAELKGITGKPSELQLYNVDQIRRSGGIAIVLYPDDYPEFQRMIREINENVVKFNLWRRCQADIFDRPERWG